MKKTIIGKAAKRITAMILAAMLGLSVPMTSYAAAVKESNYEPGYLQIMPLTRGRNRQLLPSLRAQFEAGPWVLVFTQRNHFIDAGVRAVCIAAGVDVQTVRANR